MLRAVVGGGGLKLGVHQRHRRHGRSRRRGKQLQLIKTVGRGARGTESERPKTQENDDDVGDLGRFEILTVLSVRARSPCVTMQKQRRSAKLCPSEIHDLFPPYSLRGCVDYHL